MKKIIIVALLTLSITTPAFASISMPSFKKSDRCYRDYNKSWQDTLGDQECGPVVQARVTETCDLACATAQAREWNTCMENNSVARTRAKGWDIQNPADCSKQ